MGNRLATINMGRKLRRCAPFLESGVSINWYPDAPSRLATIPESRLARGLHHTKWHLNPSSRLATTDMGRKLGVCSFFRGVELGPYLKQCRLGRGLPPYQVAS